MIPIKFDSQKANQTDNKLIDQVTLQVVLLGKKVDSKEDDPEDTAQEEIVRSFPAINDDIDLEEVTGSDGSVSYEPTKNYPIRPNIIYHIGNKPSDEEEGTPESLAGTKVNIVAEEWTNQEINVEFPSVPIMATMELLDENDQPYNTDSYVFDCIGIIDDNISYASSKVEIDDKEYDQYYQGYQMKKRLTLRIHSSVLKDKWNLGVASGDGKMLYRYDENTKSYEQLSFDSEQHGNVHEQDTYDIPLIMTDYVDESQSSDHIRSVTLHLTSGQGRVYPMTIKQYNAIIIGYTEDNKTKKIGFSHYDWGTERNANGIITTEGETAIWNYLGTASTNIYGDITQNTYDSGSENYNNALTQMNKSAYRGLADPFYQGSGEDASGNGSALYKAAIPRLKADNIGHIPSSFWFLPAYYEMEAFIKESINPTTYIVNWNLSDKKKYWTSSVGYSKTSFNIYIDWDNGDDDYVNFDWTTSKDFGTDRKNPFYMRQACVVGGDND